MSISKIIARTITALIVGGVFAAAAQAQTIKATASFDGEKPKRSVMKMGADAYCEKFHGDKQVGSEDYMIKKGKMKNVVVYVKGGLADTIYEAPAEKPVLDQSGCMYSPHVMTVQVGQMLIIRNSDNTLHNIHSQSTEQAQFNIAQPKKGLEKEVDFKREEFVKVKCDVHPWMSAYVAVFKHPFHAVTDEDGAATLDKLPPGEYTIAAWHEELGTQEQKVTVAAGETKEIAFTFAKK